MEYGEDQGYMKGWNPKEVSITENTTEELFKQTGKKRCCDETQKQVIALLEKGNRPYEVQAELKKIGKEISLYEIANLQKKKQEMNRNNNIDQTHWEESFDNHKRRELIKRISTIRSEKTKEKDATNGNGHAEEKVIRNATNEIEKIITSQSLN